MSLNVNLKEEAVWVSKIIYSALAVMLSTVVCINCNLCGLSFVYGMV